MLKALWNAVSFLAVVHLLALVAFAGWLWQSGRLSEDRIVAIREMLAPTLADIQAAAEADAKRAEADRRASDAEARMNTAPVTASEQISMISKVRELSVQSEQALAQEREMFTKQLEEKTNQLAQRELAFAERQRKWEESIEEERRRRTDAQFTKTVSLLEQMGPKAAKESIVQLMRDGAVDQAVAYMNAMSERIAARVLVEMKDPSEAGLATVLLERLRRFGLEAEPDEVTSDANSNASAS